MTSNITMPPADNAPTGEQRQQLLQSCKALIFKWASVHFKGYLDRLDEQLFRMADKAGGGEQSRYLQARSELQNQRRRVEKQLLEHLRQAFEHFLGQRATALDLTRVDAELTLVENDELEQSIAVATMTRRANADCAEALYALNQRLSVLIGGRKIDDQGNPVAPAVFAEGLRAALAELTLDTPAKLVVYKVFSAAVIAPLHKLYDLLNHELRQRGVLPHLRYHIVKTDNATLPEELASFERPERLGRQIELIQLVQRLLAGSGGSAPGLSFALPALQLAANLRALQRESAMALAAAATPQAVAATAYAGLPELIRGQTRAAAPTDADTIELVGLLFDYVLDDERLPDSVKALLSYLHTPVLKVALLDKAFFQQPQHPARQLLNSLVAAGERWVEPEGKHKSDVYQQMKAVVQRLLTEFDDDPRLFTQLAFDFNHYLRQHARRIRLAEQRAAQAARGEDTLKEVRQRVETLLQDRCAGQALPAELQRLLFEPWAQFLAFNLLRGGEHSAAWNDAVATVDEALAHWRLPPGFERLRRGKALRERLQQGLQTVGYDDARGSELLAALQRHEPPPAATAPTAPRAPAPRPEPTPELTGLAALEFGTWFEFDADRPRAERRQLKLAWSNGRTQHYMFVNRLGQQVAVRDGAELAADIRAGRARVLPRDDGRPFFEKALERIAEQLRRRPRA